MIRVKAITTHMGFYCGRPGLVHTGEVLDLPEAVAQRLMHKGLVELASQVEPEPEIAEASEDGEEDVQVDKVDKRSKAYRDAQKAKG